VAKQVKVELVKDCRHTGENKAKGDKVTVTEDQKKVMQKHGLVAEDK